MKNFKSLFLAAAFAVALSGVSQAAVSTTPGQADPGPIAVTGSLAKYVNFTKMDTDINLGNMGGAQLQFAFTHSPSSSTFPSGDYGGSNADAAEITFDSNTHIRLDIAAIPDLKTTDANGIVDTIPTQFHIELKGREVKDAGTGQTLINNNNSTFSLTDHSNTAQAYIFKHGPASGINLSLMFDRTGLDDHAGTYTTSAVMTWSDLG